jgi:ubiquinone biosynthesis protein COQ4
VNARTAFFEPDTSLPLFDERRPALKLRPRKALHHFRELLKDKENTEEVFRIFEALPWRGLRSRGEAFIQSAAGLELRAREPYLPPVLDNHEGLRQLPASSLGHAYCDFMEREGLTAQGLVDEFDRFAADKPDYRDQFKWYLNRTRDCHDMLHVLTGYGRDALGEACVLAFTYGQQPALANVFIAYMAGLNIGKQVKSSAPVLRAIREAQARGKACPRIIEQSITDLLALPLEDARRRLNITPALHYRAAHAVWGSMGVDPYDLLGKNAA